MVGFNKKGFQIRFELGNKAQELAYSTDCWSYLCKIVKPIAQNLSEKEYFKIKWYGNTVVFWRINGVIKKYIK